MKPQLPDDDIAQYQSTTTRLYRLETGGPEDPHYIGDPGEPAFQNGWSNYDSLRARAALYTQGGWVHLQGVIRNVAGTVSQGLAFDTGIAPFDARERWFTQTYSTGVIRVELQSTGGVNIAATVAAGGGVSLDGIRYRYL